MKYYITSIYEGDLVYFTGTDEELMSEWNYNIEEALSLTLEEANKILEDLAPYDISVNKIEANIPTELEQFLTYINNNLDKLREGSTTRKAIYSIVRLYTDFKKENKDE